jgi:phosphoesterase RecJ-like protein
VVVLDTGAWSQLEPLEDYLRGRAESVITIDHHERGDAVGSERIVMTGTASCTQVIVPIIDALGVDLSVGGDDDGCFSIAEAILLGLATDTGWFRFESCGPDSMRLAARLLDAGANKNRLIRIIEESDRPQRIEMTARALTSAQFANDDRSVVMCLSARDFEETGARPEELSGLVNSPMSVGSVEVSALLTEVEVGMVKMSFRSKPAISGSGRGFIDVNALAGRFNGGGHVHAAGARLVATLEEARTRVEEAIESALQDAGFAASGSTV